MKGSQYRGVLELHCVTIACRATMGHQKLKPVYPPEPATIPIHTGSKRPEREREEEKKKKKTRKKKVSAHRRCVCAMHTCTKPDWTEPYPRLKTTKQMQEPECNLPPFCSGKVMAFECFCTGSQISELLFPRLAFKLGEGPGRKRNKNYGFDENRPQPPKRRKEKFGETKTCEGMTRACGKLF